MKGHSVKGVSYTNENTMVFVMLKVIGTSFFIPNFLQGRDYCSSPRLTEYSQDSGHLLCAALRKYDFEFLSNFFEFRATTTWSTPTLKLLR